MLGVATFICQGGKLTDKRIIHTFSKQPIQHMTTNSYSIAHRDLSNLISGHGNQKPSLELVKDARALQENITEFQRRHAGEIARLETVQAAVEPGSAMKLILEMKQENEAKQKGQKPSGRLHGDRNRGA